MSTKTNTLRTILVIYTDNKLSKKLVQSCKKYAFNTKARLKVGDRVTSADYSTAMQVVEILDRSYKYVNLSNGELGDKRTSTSQFEIRELILEEQTNENAVIATKLAE